MTTKLGAVELLLSDNRGRYIPRDFALAYTDGWTGVSDEDREALQDADGESYWDTWNDVLDHAEYITPEGTWRLYQDGDLWAINIDQMTNEEKRNFGFEVECLVCKGEIRLNTDCVVHTCGAWLPSQNICGQQCFDELTQNNACFEYEQAESDLHDEFSTRACDECNTTLGGSRNIVSIAMTLNNQTAIFAKSVCVDCEIELMGA